MVPFFRFASLSGQIAGNEAWAWASRTGHSPRAVSVRKNGTVLGGLGDGLIERQGVVHRPGQDGIFALHLGTQLFSDPGKKTETLFGEDRY